VFGAKREDERLSGTGDAANDAVAFAQGPRHLLLVQVHHCQDAVFLNAGLGLQRRRDLADPNLGKYQRAQSVELGQRQGGAQSRRHHFPQPRTENFRIGALGHFVFEHAAVFGEDVCQVGLCELLA
jgi:hypothetical protein